MALTNHERVGKEMGNPAETAAKAILESRGNTPRLNRNTLVFLAADKVRLQDLDEALRKYLAWSSILEEKVTLDLTPFQVRQAETQEQAADDTVTARLPETYQWVLVPEQKTPQSAVTWESLRLSGTDALAVRASKKLKSDELFILSLGSTILRKHLDDVPLWSGDHVAVKELVKHFSKYLYLPRLAGPEVLAQSIRDGLALLTWPSDSFAYADSYDEAAGRYRGLRGGQVFNVTQESAGLLVKPDVAKRQIDAEVPKPILIPDGTNGGTGGSGGSEGVGKTTDNLGGGGTNGTRKPAATLPKRFHGTVVLDAARVGRDASKIAEEVIAHLTGLVGAKVQVTLEIEADIPSGASDQVVRTVTENSRTLKFTSHGFERE